MVTATTTAVAPTIVTPELAATDGPLGVIVGAVGVRGQVVFDLWRRGPDDADFAPFSTVLAGHVPPSSNDPVLAWPPMPVDLVPTDVGVAAVSGEFGVSVQFVDPAGVAGPLIELARGPTFGAVGLWDAGALAVVWSDFRNGRAEVFFDRVQPDGTRDFARGLRVATPPGAAYIDGLSLEHFDGDYLLAYGNNPSSYVQRLTRAGALVGPQAVVDGAAPSLAVAPFGVGVATSARFQTLDIALQPTGEPLVDPFSVETLAVAGPSGYLWVVRGFWAEEIRSITPTGRLAAPPVALERALSMRRAALVTVGASLSAFAPSFSDALGRPQVTETRVDFGCDAGRACLDDDGACSGEGHCVEAAAEAPEGLVCGCDGLDHASWFDAAGAGVGVASPGRCGGARPCGRTADCGAGALCRLPEALCGGAGVCEPALPDCGGAVCGACDLLDYADACAAAAVGQPALVAGAGHERVCGLWGTGHERRVCGAPADEPWTPCDAPPTECAPGEQRREACPGGGVTVALCVEGAFGPPSACLRPYPGPCSRRSTLDVVENVDAFQHFPPVGTLPPDMDFVYVDGRLASGVSAAEEVTYETDADGRILTERIDRGRDGQVDVVGRWDWGAAPGPRVSWDEGEDGSIERVDEYRLDALGRLVDGRWADGTAVAFTPDGLPFHADRTDTFGARCAGQGGFEPCSDVARFETQWDYSCWACDDAGCIDTRVCPAVPTEVACGRNGRGRAVLACDGDAGVLGPCADPDVCTDGDSRARRCGEIYQRSTCVSGVFEPFAPCDAPRPVIPPAPCVESKFSLGRLVDTWVTRFDALGRPMDVGPPPDASVPAPSGLALGFWRQYRDSLGRVTTRDDTRIGYPARGPGRVVIERVPLFEAVGFAVGFHPYFAGDGAPGDPDRPNIVHHVDAAGRDDGWDVDADRDGVVDGRAWVTHGADGTAWRTIDFGGGVFRTTRKRFDVLGRLIEEADDPRGDGSFDEVTRVEYAPDGGVTYTGPWGRSITDGLGRTLLAESGSADFGYHVVLEQAFDDDGRLVRAVGDAFYGERTFGYDCWDCDAEGCAPW
jgi:hypothetical protein